MSEINVCFGCAPKGAQTEGSTEGGAEGSAEGSTEARGGHRALKKMKKPPQHLVQDPYLAISKISQVTRYSSYITRFVQKLKWLRSVICK